MDILDTLNIAATGMGAQRVRLQAVASNLANARTTRTDEGGPYQRKMPVFESRAVDPFGDMLSRELSTVEVTGLETSTGERLVHDPGHPDADEDGYVAYPDIDILSEMVDMMTAARSYEANARAVDTTRDMAMRALDIGR
jgi:flagellar basal-body rod protein FlgC